MEAVIGAVYLDAGLAAARTLLLPLLADRLAGAAAGPGEADYKTRLQEPSARQFGQLPRYDVSGDGPDHDQSLLRRGPHRRDRAGPGHRPVQEAGRAGRRPGRLAVPPGRARTHERTRIHDRDREPYRRCLSCPRSRPSGASSSARSSASGSRRSRSPARARSAATTKKARSSASSTGAKITARRPHGASTCCCPLDTGDVLVIHLGMSGQLLRATRPRTRSSQAHPRRHHLHPGRPAPLRRPPHVRRDVRGRRRRPSTDEVPELAHLGFDPVEQADVVDRRSARLLVNRSDEAQAAPDGPDVHRRHRQHLRRRDPLRRRPALRPR